MMYAVRMKDYARRQMRIGPKHWVGQDNAATYVTKSKRGLWPTRDEAARHVAHDTEEVVEVTE